MLKSSSTVKRLAITAVVLTVLILAPVGSQAADVIFDSDQDGKAIRIENLDVDGTSYNVDFWYAASGKTIYGGPPGVFDFTTLESATAAVEAANAALDAAGAIYVGQETEENDSPTNIRLYSQLYFVGYQMGRNIGPSKTMDTVFGKYEGLEWFSNEDNLIYTDGRTIALFSPAAPPEPVDEVTIGGNVWVLEGSGLVLQNNSGDDETVSPSTGDDLNVPFTFDTPLAPGSTYEVTVKTQPSNPDQECVVARGSGTVPIEDVTNVVVICGPLRSFAPNAHLPGAVYLPLLLNN